MARRTGPLCDGKPSRQVRVTPPGSTESRTEWLCKRCANQLRGFGYTVEEVA